MSLDRGRVAASAPDRFTRFAAVDWSGAKGARHKGIAVAICGAGDAPPMLVDPPGGVWSREGVAAWLLAEAAKPDPLIAGFDFSFAPPLVDRGAYLPGDAAPAQARAFWAYVDRRCDDPDLGAASLLEVHHRRHFYFGAADGAKAGYMHFRRCEARFNATRGGKASTVYDAIGAAQVAKASFAGMRLLHRIGARVPVWPFDPLPDAGPVVVEIYTSLAARDAGGAKGRSKLRDAAALDAALARLGSAPHAPLPAYDDHRTDAILAAAWLRASAHRAALWRPEPLTPRIARTEGWTFGVE